MWISVFFYCYLAKCDIVRPQALDKSWESQERMASVSQRARLIYVEKHRSAMADLYAIIIRNTDKIFF